MFSDTFTRTADNKVYRGTVDVGPKCCFFCEQESGLSFTLGESVEISCPFGTKIYMVLYYFVLLKISNTEVRMKITMNIFNVLPLRTTEVGYQL